MNYFEVFGLPRRLRIDAVALQRRFYELSRQHHPDFHQAAPPAEQARALEASARVNAAYRTLRDPLARIDYLVRLEEGRETREGAAVTPKAPAALLQEMFEIQESVQEAKTGGLDARGRAAFAAERDRLRTRYGEEEARLTGPLSDAWDTAAPEVRRALLPTFKEGLATRAYLRTVIDDLGAVLEGQEHVTHHRH
ncbi:MAG: Fe-S protein assembly co-chaperone HscB [Candidatus Rokuibacteriota bacterium]